MLLSWIDVTLPTDLKTPVADRYLIEREIGRGGMATVYLARDLRHDRPVAVKLLSPELGAILGIDRFLAEIRLTASLQHPNLLPLFDSGEINGQPFYVMPYVEGENLRQRLDRETQLPVDEVIRIAVAVAGALEYAHARGVVHRDLKPENILLQSGQPVVADFGIALAVSKAGGARLTQTGLSLGTPQYMSPEQAAGDKVIDGRSDIYSLAAVTYEMLTGEPPHTGATIQAVIARLLTERPRDVRTSRPSVPEHVAVSIERALEKLPADRWVSAADFADALRGRTVLQPRAARVEARASRTMGDRVRDPVVLGALALALASGSFALWSSRQAMRDDGFAVRFTVAPAAPGERIQPAAQIAISPDGRAIAYVLVDDTGYTRIAVRELGQANARVLPGTESAITPFFSPDGSWIGFIVGAHIINKVPVAGGPVTKVCETNSLQGASWATPDTIIASVRDTLMIVPAHGGAPQPMARSVAGVEGERGRRNPRVLYDGKTVLYQSWRGSFAQSTIGVTSLGDGKTQLLDIAGASPVGVVDGYLIYGSSTGALMAVAFDVASRRVSGKAIPVIDKVGLTEQVGLTTGGVVRAAVSRNGSLVYATGERTKQLVMADTVGRVRVLLEQPRDYGPARFSPDGKRVALSILSISNTRSDIWIYDIGSATLTKLTSEGEQNFRPEWTPDGKRVLYGSNRSRPGALWWQNADLSGGAELLQGGPEGVNGGMVSPDGRVLVYWRSTPGVHPADIFYRALRGDTTSKPLAATAAVEIAPRFSPDGKWVAYTSDQDATMQVYVQPFPPTGARYQVTSTGGMTPVWSPDGSRIFYVGAGSLNAATVRTSPSFAVVARAAVLAGNYLLSTPPYANFDVSPDGQHFLVLRAVGATDRIVAVHDWKYELRERLRR